MPEQLAFALEVTPVVEAPPPPPNPIWREGTAKYELYWLLRRAFPEWLPVRRLQDITAKYTQRINNAGEMNDYFRPLGWKIWNYEHKSTNRSWYRFGRI